MSWHATSWAKAQRTGAPERKALLLVLADYVNAEGVAYPSRQTLMEEAEFGSLDSVDRHMKKLVELGFVLVERRKDAAGKQLPNVYRLNVDLSAQRKHLRGNRH